VTLKLIARFTVVLPSLPSLPPSVNFCPVSVNCTPCGADTRVCRAETRLGAPTQSKAGSRRYYPLISNPDRTSPLPHITLTEHHLTEHPASANSPHRPRPIRPRTSWAARSRTPHSHLRVSRG